MRPESDQLVLALEVWERLGEGGRKEKTKENKKVIKSEVRLEVIKSNKSLKHCPLQVHNQPRSEVTKKWRLFLEPSNSRKT